MMILREKVAYIILIFILFTFVVSLGSINNFLSFQTDKTVQFDESIYVVPHHWNTTDELNMSLRWPVATSHKKDRNNFQADVLRPFFVS